MNGVTVIPDVANAHYGCEEVPEQVEHPDTGETIATIAWHSSDAWRGWYEATPVDGWEKVGEGCNCGSWDDTPPGTSDAECQAEIEKLAAEHGEVVLVLCGGSNVMAMQYDVLARKA
jgi:hypothetical protein